MTTHDAHDAHDAAWAGMPGRAATREFRSIVYGGLLISALVFVAVCRPWVLVRHFAVGAPIGRDFTNFWMGGHLALMGKLELLIDLPAYSELMSRTFAYGWADGFVFSYPPHILFLTVPFALLPYTLAVCGWTAMNVAAAGLAVRLMNPDWRWVAVACLSPAVLTSVMYGHFGGLLGLAAVFVLLNCKQRPLLCGVILAAASVKPQFAAVLGLLLLLSGHWRALAWSIPAGLTIVGLSVAAFGLPVWLSYVSETLPFHARLLADFNVQMLWTVISAYAGLRLSGAPGWLAQIVQYAFTAVVLLRAAQLLRREGANPYTMAAGLLAALAALPYVNGYDLAVVAPALTLALFADRNRPPLLAGLAAALLWVLPPLGIPLGWLESPLPAAVFAGTLLLALFRRDVWKTASPARQRKP
jgi:hypothetical protein